MYVLFYVHMRRKHHVNFSFFPIPFFPKPLYQGWPAFQPKLFSNIWLVRLYRSDGQMKHLRNFTICQSFLGQFQNFNFPGRQNLERFRTGFTVGWLVGRLDSAMMIGSGVKVAITDDCLLLNSKIRSNRQDALMRKSPSLNHQWAYFTLSLI